MKKCAFYGQKLISGHPQRLILMMILTSLLLSACNKAEEENIVVIEAEEENAAYGLIAVTKDDVILSKNVTCTYTQTKEQTVSFPVGGKRVSKVHVNPGDTVNPGDILIELSEDNLGAEIDELEYKIAKNTLLLGYLDKAEEFDKESAYNNFVYYTDKSEDDLKKYDKNVESIERDYDYRREDYKDEIEFDQKKLNKLKSEQSGSKIYATMSGTVYSVAEHLEGSTSQKDEVVMKIVDSRSGFFESSDEDCAKHFKEGDVIEMSIVYGNASGEYELTPYNISSWGEIQRFDILSGPENEGIDVGTTGTLKLILEKHENVLSLPLGAVYHADGKPYVYVLDENNFRQMAFIETGLTGDDKVEITGGLNEGDKVVYK
ncbi:MAG: efflux RND transporter periplasmic adaptor subunit [Lachnospiraceae bacterium]|nr:efflux RND transporter periplasmic adaptor subunit [Lachnospiraceae bacterium]